ncbi:MAG: DUF4105 domain-containing protein [Pseudomonadales bacterium]|nr:DUF4105 domain-containing protein [Pseudomonadales bacterium]
MAKYLFLLTHILCCSSVFASSPDITLDELEQQLIQISIQPVWLKLMRYDALDNKAIAAESNFDQNIRTKSAIHSADFFLSPDGGTVPLLELKATLSAFKHPVGDDPNMHPQCRFRGRYIWLKSQLKDSWFKKLSIMKCPDFERWSLAGTTHSISVVYATGYLGNPASYYGHTLIKFNAGDSSSSTKLLDVSLNYGAIVPDTENPLVYIAKGLLGGYESGFTHSEYFYHTHNYAENDLRDLWEYQLALTQAEVDLIVAHGWELLGKKNTYYFFNKNCAYRMAELLEVINGIQLASPDAPWYLPQTVVQKLSLINRGGKPLVEGIKYHPSRQSRLYSKYRQLDFDQRKLVKRIIDDTKTLDTNKFVVQPLTAKHLILDTLLDYYQAFDGKANKQNYNQILLQRYQLAPGVPRQVVDRLTPPHLGRYPSRSQIKILHNSRMGSGFAIALRPAYYDALDSSGTQVPFAALSMLELEIAVLDNDFQLRALNIVEIQSVNARATGLPNDRHWAWKLRAGIENQDLACRKNCRIWHVVADKGFSYSPRSKILVAGYLGMGVQDNRHDSGNLYFRTSTTAYWNITNKLKMGVDLEHREYIDGSYANADKFGLTFRLELAKNFELRIAYHKDQAREASVGLGYYW